MSEDTYTIKEFIKHTMDDMSGKIDLMHSDVREIKTQTTVTNGRVTRLEDKISDYEQYKADVRSLTNYRWWIIGAVASFAVLGGTIIYFVAREIDGKISKGIAEQFDNRFSAIEIINK